mmetsp:Transcript_32466/g.52590  ORF Transcript_32466/g.52590 Transcript_32466/m.52590 type:complete len:209 (-) Transcript_32466:19-645(-)
MTSVALDSKRSIATSVLEVSLLLDECVSLEMIKSVKNVSTKHSLLKRPRLRRLSTSSSESSSLLPNGEDRLASYFARRSKITATFWRSAAVLAEDAWVRFAGAVAALRVKRKKAESSRHLSGLGEKQPETGVEQPGCATTSQNPSRSSFGDSRAFMSKSSGSINELILLHVSRVYGRNIKVIGREKRTPRPQKPNARQLAKKQQPPKS